MEIIKLKLSNNLNYCIKFILKIKSANYSQGPVTFPLAQGLEFQIVSNSGLSFRRLQKKKAVILSKITTNDYLMGPGKLCLGTWGQYFLLSHPAETSCLLGIEARLRVTKCPVLLACPGFSSERTTSPKFLRPK
uniref:Uncharacterized protein n=1 Tax=Pipistrellus kuhlii TaxID=59472 RepID=A0A7J7YYB9_PIPKU|nr:hypothetical protein mPipKuh1_009866 [Pipistrellus kuhlii]